MLVDIEFYEDDTLLQVLEEYMLLIVVSIDLDVLFEFWIREKDDLLDYENYNCVDKDLSKLVFAKDHEPLISTQFLEGLPSLIGTKI